MLRADGGDNRSWLTKRWHLASPLAGLAILCACSVALAADTSRAHDPAAAPPTWRPQGIDPALLRRGHGTVRVRVLLSEQPLLERAMTGRLAALLRPKPELATRSASQRSSTRITIAERQAAIRAQRSYERAVDKLAPAAERTSGLLGVAAKSVRAAGGRVVDRELLPAAVIARLPSHVLGRVQRLAVVQAIELAPAERPQSGIGTAVVGAPTWWAAGFTGGEGPSDNADASVGLVSEVPNREHPAFDEVSIESDPTYAADGHGTRTAGVIASRDASYRGVAVGLSHLVAGGQAFVLGIATASGAGASTPAQALSRSFASAATLDSDGDSDDVLTNIFGVGQALAASNENVDGSPTVANIGRNTMSVGAFNDDGQIDSTEHVVLGVSSRGPTPGGRKKPDLVAPGGQIMTPSIDWNQEPHPTCVGAGPLDTDGTCPDFSPRTGTSFAAPHVAGAMALLEGAGIGDPMVQRAILINSARFWNGDTDNDPATNDPDQTHWQPDVGWGELDLTTALAQRGNYQLGEVKGGEAAFFRAEVPGEAKTTLAYEMRGYFENFPNPGTQTLTYTQTNLDLRQYDSSGAEIAPPVDPDHGGGPDAVDPNDTVEQVRAPLGGTQEITYKVEATTSVEGADAEPFAIASASPLTPLEPPLVRPIDVSADPFGPVRCGELVSVSTTLRNGSSDLAADSAQVSIELPSDVSLESGDQVQQVAGGSLGAGATSGPHTWTVAPEEEGDWKITVVGSGSGLGTQFERAESMVLKVDCTPPKAALNSGPTGPTRDQSPEFEFSASGGAERFECALDGESFLPCQSPYTTPRLDDGAHTFSVRAVDAAGNVDPDPEIRTFAIDSRVARPRVAFVGRQRVRGRRVGRVRISAGERARAELTGVVKVRRRRIPLRDAVVTVAGGARERQVMRVPRRHASKLRRALRRGRLVRATVAVRFEDEVGNQARRRLKVRLR